MMPPTEADRARILKAHDALLRGAAEFLAGVEITVEGKPGQVVAFALAARVIQIGCALPSYNRARLKAGEEVSLDLHSEEVLLLFKHLTNLYEVAKGGVQPGSRQLQVIDRARGVAVFAGQEAQLLTQLVTQYGNAALFAELRKLKPNLLSAAGLAAIHEKRSAAVKQFEDQMKAKTSIPQLISNQTSQILSR